MAISAAISGCSGPHLTPDEKAFFKEYDPWGFILFKRNCDNPDQIRALVEDLRAVVGRRAPVLIDQEGGRVQRLGPPHWPAYPRGAAYGALYGRNAEKGLEAARLGARLIANDLHQLGIDVDCLPLLDIPAPNGHDAIGERAYGRDAASVAAIGRAAAEGLLAGGVLPVVKHMPGQGRAEVDSHHALPVVDAARDMLEVTDFTPFRQLADLPLAMTAHVVYSAIDATAPATQSAMVVSDIIRGHIGFQGLLMSDDIGMGALSGTMAERVRASHGAGLDVVLHCNGRMEEMQEVALATRTLEGDALGRAEAALARIAPPEALDTRAAKEQFLDLLMARS